MEKRLQATNMTDEQIKELEELVKSFEYRPCKDGHVFTYSSSSTNSECPPDVRCMCGAFTWAQLQENTGK